MALTNIHPDNIKKVCDILNINKDQLEWCMRRLEQAPMFGTEDQLKDEYQILKTKYDRITYLYNDILSTNVDYWNSVRNHNNLK